jgi:hypothetical protein
MVNRLHSTFGIVFLMATLLRTHARMPSPVFLHDCEWVDRLVGLPMAVPEHWWSGFNSSALCLGKIILVYANVRTFNLFVLKVHNTPGQRYGMHYDAVFLYANKNHPDITRYHLPPNPPGDPAQEQSVHVLWCRCRPHVIPHGLPPLILAPRHALLRQASSDESDSEEGDESDDKYLVTYTDPVNWVLVMEDNIDSIEDPAIEKKSYKPREGKDKDCDVKISVNELASLEDDNGEF